MASQSSPSYFAIDAGNTRIKYGLFTCASSDSIPVCNSSGHVMCGQPLPRALFESLEGGHVEAVLSGSNPPETERLQAEWPKSGPPLTLLADRSRLPIKTAVDFPEKVGLDRLLNAVAAHKLQSNGSPVIIVDSGTAVTVDYVDQDGVFRGGAILPGIGMGARALHQYTALLPLMHAPGIAASAPDVIGRNTLAAMTSGLYWGHVGAVCELVKRMATLTPGVVTRRVLVTGGAGGVVSPHLEQAEEWPFLPLQGLVLAYRSLRA